MVWQVALGVWYPSVSASEAALWVMWGGGRKLIMTLNNPLGCASVWRAKAKLAISPCRHRTASLKSFDRRRQSVWQSLGGCRTIVRWSVTRTRRTRTAAVRTGRVTSVTTVRPHPTSTKRTPTKMEWATSVTQTSTMTVRRIVYLLWHNILGTNSGMLQTVVDL